MKYSLLVLLLFSVLAKADGIGGATCMPNCNDYNQGDHFQWDSYDSQVHMLLGFGVGFTAAYVLEHKAGLPVWEAALISTLGTMVLGAAKENFIDDYNSRSDTREIWIGSCVAGATLWTFHF